MDSDDTARELEALRVVEHHLARAISNIRGKKNFFKRGSQLQTIALAVLSTTTTLLIALNQIYHRSILATLSLVAGALMTVAAAWAGWYGFHRLWLANAATLVKLWAVRDQIEYDKALYGDAPSRALIDGYHQQFRQILAEHDQTWQQIRSAEQ